MIPRNERDHRDDSACGRVRMEVWRKVRVRGRFCYRKFRPQILFLYRPVAQRCVWVTQESATTYSFLWHTSLTYFNGFHISGINLSYDITKLMTILRCEQFWKGSNRVPMSVTFHMDRDRTVSPCPWYPKNPLYYYWCRYEGIPTTRGLASRERHITIIIIIVLVLETAPGIRN